VNDGREFNRFGARAEENENFYSPIRAFVKIPFYVLGRNVQHFSIQSGELLL
jgi:hypothetical protein